MSSALRRCVTVRVPRADERPCLRVADLRLVRRPGLFHADPRRPDRRPLARRETHGHSRRAFDERRPPRHDVRPQLSNGARHVDPRIGLLKGNISAQVGTLYPHNAESLRERGFTIFSTGINVGAVAGPIATGTVAAIYGWHAGFGLAAVLMLVALLTYLMGQRLPSGQQSPPYSAPRPAAADAGRKRSGAGRSSD